MKGAVDLRIYLTTTSRVVRKEQTRIMGDSVIVLQKGHRYAICSLRKQNAKQFFFAGEGAPLNYFRQNPFKVQKAKTSK